MSTDTSPAVTQPSTSHDTTETKKAIAQRREQFDKRFAPIWEAFRSAKPLSVVDKSFLKKEFVSAEDYLYYSDVYIFRPGVELVDNRITLIYLPSAPHEAVARLVSTAVDRTYNCFPGGNLIDLGSSSLRFLPKLAKQPDASFRPRIMPAPNPQNKLKYQPGTQNHFPTVVVEVACRNETRARLSSDASTKYFQAATSIKLWIGFKINHDDDPQEMTFFGIWGVRNATGIGLNEREYFQDGNGTEVCHLIFSPIPLVGQFTIPSEHFFLPDQVPHNVPANIILSYEAIRVSLQDALS